MQLKDIFTIFGFRQKTCEYGYTTSTVNLPVDGEITIAQWLHPKSAKIEISQDEINYLRFFLKPGDAAIDIGTHSGDTAIPIALATGVSGTVLALEQNKYVFKILEKNSELIRIKGNILPLPFAATPDDCAMEFEYSDPGFCNGGFHEGISK